MPGKGNIDKNKRGANQTHFGFQSVGEKKRQGRVNRVFESVADRYDLMNDLMSGGLHRIWKRHLVNRIRPRPGMAFLDLAGGTGDIAFRILEVLGEKAGKTTEITVSDINGEMLRIGEARAMDRGFWKKIRWVKANAEKLPFRDDQFDICTMAFGIRNVTRIQKVIGEAYRVLKPGGQFLVMEFWSAVLPLLEKPYDWYSFEVIPRVGKAVTGDEESYKYLVESIRQFPKPGVFEDMEREEGFARIRRENLSGGIVTLFRGWKI